MRDPLTGCGRMSKLCDLLSPSVVGFKNCLKGFHRIQKYTECAILAHRLNGYTNCVHSCLRIILVSDTEFMCEVDCLRIQKWCVGYKNCVKPLAADTCFTA